MKNMGPILLVTIIALHLASAAHFIVGYVNNATDGEPANGKTVVLWNPIVGVLDNVTDTIGPTGNSGSHNIYLIDCELLGTPCDLGDNVSVTVVPENGYSSQTINVTITGAGFDLADNLTLQSPSSITSVEIDDEITNPIQEIDLTVAGTKLIWCAAVIVNGNNETNITNASATFFHSSASYGDADDNNNHYTNSSCELDLSYGDANQALSNCTLEIEYYANPGTWNCTVESYDVTNTSIQGTNTTTVNELLGIGVDSPINFGTIGSLNLSPEVTVNITNYGNVRINLSIEAYADNPGDADAMNCTTNNISIEHQKFNATTSYGPNITLDQVLNNYTNLTTSTIIGHLNLSARTNDILNDANKSTYWRMYVPQGVGGNCTGNTILGAIQSPGI